MKKLSITAIGDHYSSDSPDVIETVQDIFDKLASTIFLKHELPAYDCHLILDGLFQLCKDPFFLDSSLINETEEVFLYLFVEPLIEHSIQRKNLHQEFFTSLTMFFSLEKTTECFTDDYCCLELIRPFLLVLVKILERMTKKIDNGNQKSWKIQVSTVSKSESFKDEILELFVIVQKISMMIQNNLLNGITFMDVVERTFKGKIFGRFF